MIGLHTYHNNETIYVNPTKIQIIAPYGDEETGTQITLDNSSVKVKENMKTVLDLLEMSFMFCRNGGGMNG